MPTIENTGSHHGDARGLGSASHSLQAAMNRPLLQMREANASFSSEALLPPPLDEREKELWKDYGKVGLDCPMRARSRKLCSWTPRDRVEGFPDIYKVREHVAAHGIICQECQKCFRGAKKWMQHWKHRNEHHQCLPTGHVDSEPGSPLQQSPEALARYFHSKLPQGSDAEKWHEGYKILWPDWQAHHLPSPYYRENTDRELSMNSGARNTDFASIAASFTSLPGSVEHGDTSPDLPLLDLVTNYSTNALFDHPTEDLSAMSTYQHSLTTQGAGSGVDAPDMDTAMFDTPPDVVNPQTALSYNTDLWQYDDYTTSQSTPIESNQGSSSRPRSFRQPSEYGSVDTVHSPRKCKEHRKRLINERRKLQQMMDSLQDVLRGLKRGIRRLSSDCDDEIEAMDDPQDQNDVRAETIKNICALVEQAPSEPAID